MHLSAIYRYPVKSTAAESLAEAEVQARGLAGDRRWMVVDPEGQFLTGRKHPQLVQLSARLNASGLTLSHALQGAVQITTPEPGAARRTVEVWSEPVSALDAGELAAEFLSALLGQPARLVYMDAAARRLVDPKYAQPGDEVSFADGFPLLLISQAALEQLNKRAAHPVPMQRFRPNLVIEGCGPHAEDGWRRIRIGAVEFELAKPCVRCVFTTVDPQTASFDSAGEPLATLKHYRRGPKGITFGQNLIARGEGKLHLGDPVSILESLL